MQQESTDAVFHVFFLRSLNDGFKTCVVFDIMTLKCSLRATGLTKVQMYHSPPCRSSSATNSKSSSKTSTLLWRRRSGLRGGETVCVSAAVEFNSLFYFEASGSQFGYDFEPFHITYIFLRKVNSPLDGLRFRCGTDVATASSHRIEWRWTNINTIQFESKIESIFVLFPLSDLKSLWTSAVV